MADYVLDSYAMLAFFRNEPGAEKVKQLLQDAAADKCELYMSCMNAGEVFYITYRKDGSVKADIAWKALMQFPIHIFGADVEFSLAAAKIKARYSLSYADAFAAALTVKRKATLITGDEEFKPLARETDFKVKWL
jgi:predicted nucleic acid-binding protein